MSVVVCQRCGHKSETIDGRPHKDGSYRRRRRCTSCGMRWTTTEIRINHAVSPTKLERIKTIIAELNDELAIPIEENPDE